MNKNITLADLSSTTRYELMSIAENKISAVMKDGKYRSAAEISEACGGFFTPGQFGAIVGNNNEFLNLSFRRIRCSAVDGYIIKCDENGKPLPNAEPKPRNHTTNVYKMIW